MFDIVKANLLSSENIYHRCYGLLRTTVGEANEPECSVEWYHVPVPEHMPPLCKGWCSAQRIKNLNDCRGQSYHNSWVGGDWAVCTKVRYNPMRKGTSLWCEFASDCGITNCLLPNPSVSFADSSLYTREPLAHSLDCTNSPESIPSGEVVPRGRLRASPTVGTGNSAGSPNRFFIPGCILREF